MVGVNAAPVVTTMQYPAAVLNLAFVQCPREAMSGNRGMAAEPDDPIAMRSDSAAPKPTSGGLFHLRPEARCGVLVDFTRSHVLPLSRIHAARGTDAPCAATIGLHRGEVPPA